MNEDTWLISDTHFGHKNIVKYCGRPLNHNELIMRNWRELVGEDEPLLHLGDLTVWYGPEQLYWEDMARTLPGDKRLILGNHDKRKARVYRKLGFQVTDPFVYEDKILFSHYPEFEREDYPDVTTVIHGHVHNNNHRRVRRLFGVTYVNVSIEVVDYKPIRLGEVLSWLS